VLIDVNGLGYEVDVPMSSFYNLPALGERVTLLTHFIVREDAQVLFGFLTHDERQTFRLLIKITGVGPRMALSLLSGLSVSELAQAVARQETGRLVKVPGIGKKTAERLLLELKGKLADAISAPATVANDAQADILQALIALGYSDREAAAALKSLPAEASVSDGIKLALKSLA
jgi:Holliday junction DNA helicase RuvA